MTSTPEADIAIAPAQPKTRAKLPFWLNGLVIASVAFICYSNTFHNPFIFDDERAIVNNAAIRRLLPPWQAMLSKENIDRPLVGLSLALNYSISGLNVWSYHAFNVTIHVLAALALFGVVRRTLLSSRLRAAWADNATPIAAASALIWAAHPLCSQAVTYVIQRSESMMALFYLLTLYCSIRGFNSKRRGAWFAAAVAACIAGMLSKPVMITAPLVVLIWDSLFESGSFVRALRGRAWLYVGLSATWAVLAAILIAAPVSRSAGFSSQVFTPAEYLRTQFGVILHYLRLSVWPSPLCLDYKWPKTSTAGSWLPQAAIVIGLVAVSVWGLLRRKPASFPGVAFFLVLSLTSSFIPIDDAANEHRMYLPLAALVVLFVLGAVKLGSMLIPRIFSAQNQALALTQLVSGLALIVVLLVLVQVTMHRNTVYASDIATWQDVINTRPDNDRAHADLAFAFAQREMHADALRHLEIACRLNPDNAATQYSLGMGLFLHGDADRAREHLENAVRLKPDAPAAEFSLGRVLLAQGNAEQALEHFTNALKLNPDYAPAYLGLGRGQERLGTVADAVKSYRAGLSRQPDWPEALDQLALTLATCENAAVRDNTEAVRLAERAVAITEAANAGPLDILAAVYAEAGRFGEATAAAEKCLNLARTAGDQAQMVDLQRRIGDYKKQIKSRPVTSIAWR